jgi:tetratricopeptide (TPR) repeat protein
LAHAEYRRGDAEAALDYLDRARSKTASDPRIELRRGEVYYRQGRSAEARVALENAVELDPELAEAHHLLAFIYGDLGRDQDATAAAARAIDLNPSYEKAETNLSLDRHSAARYNEMIGGRGAHPEAAAGMLAHYNLGLTFRQKGFYDEAWREFALALERGEDPLLVGQARAELMLLQGAADEAEELLVELLELEPSSPKLWNERGVAAHQKGALGEAERFYRHALELDPAYALARNNLAVLQHHQGADEAEASFHEALEGGRGLGDVWRNLGLMLGRQARRSEAVAAYRRALDLEPASAVAWTGLGAVLMDGGRLTEARAAFVRAVDLDPDLAEARYQLAFALSAAGDYRGALRETQRALELDSLVPAPRFRLLIDLQFEEATILAPELDIGERVHAGEEIAEFDFRSEDLDGLFAELTGIPVAGSASLDLENISEPPTGVESAAERARVALAKGQLDLAAALAQEAILAEEGDRSEFLALLGDTFLRRQLAGEALERYQEALQELDGGIDDGSRADDEASSGLRCEILLGLTRAFLMLGRIAEARDGAEELCEIRPGDPDALRILGQTLARAGQFDRAVEVLERGRAVAEEDVEIATDLGLAYLETGDLAAAERVLRGALEYDEFAVAAHGALGQVLDRMGNEDDAVASYRAALALLPSYGEVALALAELEWRRGRHDAAIAVQIELLTLDPYHLDILAQLGSVLLDAGQGDDALFAFRRVLRLDPDHLAARQGLESAGSAAASVAVL